METLNFFKILYSEFYIFYLEVRDFYDISKSNRNLSTNVKNFTYTGHLKQFFLLILDSQKYLKYQVNCGYFLHCILRYYIDRKI